VLDVGFLTRGVKIMDMSGCTDSVTTSLFLLVFKICLRSRLVRKLSSRSEEDNLREWQVALLSMLYLLVTA